MSEALDAAIRAGCVATKPVPFVRPICRWPDCGCETTPTVARIAVRAFLDAVENSQQPISHDAMQTLRLHLEVKDGQS